MERIALFGTGRELKKYISRLDSLHIKPVCLVDNDPNKWGKEIEGLCVLPPEKLAETDCRILISCNFTEEITNQLQAMGLGARLLDNQDLFKLNLREKAESYRPGAAAIRPRSEKAVLIDAFDGIGWGGMERWSYQVGGSLARRGHRIVIYGSNWQERQEPQTEKYIIRFPLNRDDFWAVVEAILRDMEQRLPFVLINNWTEHVFAAAYLLKQSFPKEVEIISIVHNDWQALYHKQAVWKDSFIRVAGVSRKIKERLIQECGLEKERVFYRENFVSLPKGAVREIRKEGEALRICWGARLEVLQKRADLLPQVIEGLEKEIGNYIFEIAGAGPCLENLLAYVRDRGLQRRVRVLGSLKPEEMPEFWKRQHIYINISEFEGASLAMLEAMSYGVVPVVTRVSGAEEFITDGENGYLVPVGDLKMLIAQIKKLYENEEKRACFAPKCRAVIREKCGIDNYMDYVEHTLLHL